MRLSTFCGLRRDQEQLELFLFSGWYSAYLPGYRAGPIGVDVSHWQVVGATLGQVLRAALQQGAGQPRHATVQFNKINTLNESP
jgi:hypothetical protein